MMVDPAPVGEISLRRSEAQQLDAERRLKQAGGGGTTGDVTDNALKPRVDFLQTAFLWLAGLMVTAILAIIGVVLSVSSAANGRTDKLVEATSALSREVGVSNAKLDETNRRLDRIERKIDGLRPR